MADVDEVVSTASEAWLIDSTTATSVAANGYAQSVDELSRSLQRFNWPDYLVFVLMLVSCIFIGIFFGYKDHVKHKNRKTARRDSEALDYLVGGRKMKIFPVAVSLVASWISGISLLGTSTEIYVYGTQYCYIVFAIILMGFVMHYIFLPVFHDLQITSAYEYLQLRFDKRMRLLGSLLFTLALLLWLPIVVYVPALAFNQVSGVNIHVITPIVCLVCIFYTSVGGVRAVVWTDVIQTAIMVGAMIIVIVKGTIDVGGLGVVIERNSIGQRFDKPDFDFDPTTRNTFWNLFIGGTFFWTSTNAINQNMLQRYLALPTLGAARKALVFFMVGTTAVLALCCYNGLLIFAMHHDCDPLSTGLAKAKDQLVPLLVMEVLAIYPGLAGLFVAGIFSAALSSLSTGLNSLSAIVLEDFCKPFVKRPLSETQTRYLMRATVLIFGALAVVLVVVVEKMGAVLQLSMSLGPVTLGPLFGLFLMGIFIPRINGTCAIIGTIGGLITMGYIVIRSQISIALGEIVFAEKPVTVAGCAYDFTPLNKTSSFPADSSQMTVEKSFHHVSFLYYTMIGSLVPTIIGYLFSVVMSFTIGYRPEDMYIDPLLLAPFLRKYHQSTKVKNMAEVLHEFETKDIQL
ncbi:sodium-coupled monocarboxylate transporter 1-like isoform X1 [Wyeomyia smithii]|uniref:sodium-coupled monocarboxylate transporter 1-like isoform X1 n=1 Tax=Wyeomyia smithii TaxID=174621 RepID=UPI0024680A0D|nr:sodium-coupled monocarboxylate transporter 1-like isoform X1 [Wyeomyia smithii]XP_055547207.1 sodium-coupled monocarboxylate transporter 1-like isoform X1 [Wyeomyia smithii]XP_055547208.1 sodium-coupled monocarboxylate transporter 1-like isoform X1 [Wyeomyia smithii]XP_055547209.1 sodium-coupled monocarboxylate transporter 1-like isoform X1 [Wyeomyia smithii]